MCAFRTMVPCATAPPAMRRLTQLLPSLVELFFAFLLLGAFGRAAAWQSLLSDGDTGWHIRAGEFILNTGSVPLHDLFSFSRPGEPWFAWEWLSDVLFARLYLWGGLAAVTGLAALVICFTAAWLLRWLLERGAGLWIALGVTLACVSASSIHYLARPHLFSMLLFAVALRILYRDLERPARMLWWLVPLSALWANLHGGFIALPATLALLLAVCFWNRDWVRLRRYGLLTALSTAATLANPYGWHLHQHIARYLTSSWIMNSVQEFQSPRIRAENMLVFAALLLAGTLCASRALARGQRFEGLLAVLWGFAALRSARHIPLYAVAAAPVIASECAAWWAASSLRAPARALRRTLWEAGEELGRSCRLGISAAILGAMALWIALPPAAVHDFPPSTFPVAAVAENRERLVAPGRPPRVLTSDQWADYLIFHLFPRQRVFFDGRSDFYGPAIGADYQTLLSLGRNWREVLARYQFDFALLPLDWPMASVLEREPHWRAVYRDAISVLLLRDELKERCGTVEGGG